MIKVSIVIPAYNVENYIDKCIDSIINQTFKDIEIIIINDGSTDFTLEKINQKSKTDIRIKVIEKENSGVIEARRVGYEEAKGEYILFVDGDDWIDLDTIKVTYDKAKEKDYDIVCFNNVWIYENGKQTKNKYEEFDTTQGYDFLKGFFSGEIAPEMTNKLIKKNFIVKNKIVFPRELAFGEDILFVFFLAISMPVACSVNQYFYYYLQRNTSVTKTITPKILDVSKSTNIIKDKLISNKIFDKYQQEFEYFAFMHNFYGRVGAIYKIKNDYSKQLYSIWKSMDIDIYINKYYIKSLKKFSIKGKLYMYIITKNYLLGKIIHKFI